MTAAIETSGLSKRFGDLTAVSNLDMTVEHGDSYGFLGPNGAGKTTTINMLLGLVEPTAGTARVLGEPVDGDTSVRSHIGVLPGHVSLYDRLSARRHIEFVARVKDAQSDPVALCERVGLGDAIDRPAGEFSSGMAGRLKLAMALVGRPDLLILDEPSTGLDPNGARDIRRIIREENERGATVLFSSHILDQVEAVCNRVGILVDGELVAEDGLDRLRARMGDTVTMRVTLDGPVDPVADRVRALDAVSSLRADGDAIEVGLDTPGDKHRVLNTIADTPASLESFEVDRQSLEDLFAEYTAGEVA